MDRLNIATWRLGADSFSGQTAKSTMDILARRPIDTSLGILTSISGADWAVRLPTITSQDIFKDRLVRLGLLDRKTSRPRLQSTSTTETHIRG